MSNKTTKEIAETITSKVALICGCAWESCTATRTATAKAIDDALTVERERAAKIAEAMRPSGGRQWTDEQRTCFNALTDCAANIRAGIEP